MAAGGGGPTWKLDDPPLLGPRNGGRHVESGHVVGVTTRDSTSGMDRMPTKQKAHKDPKREELRRLGERIRDQRRHRGLTQESLAEALELSVAYISLIERGGRNPPYTTVVAIAKALGIPTARLVSED
jgi:ribosome-binding protein aMBF1 (putative translation factor)